MGPSRQGQSASLLQSSAACIALVAGAHADGPYFVPYQPYLLLVVCMRKVMERRVKFLVLRY